MNNLSTLAETISSSVASIAAFQDQEHGGSGSNSTPHERIGPIDIATHAPDAIKKARRALLEAAMAIQCLLMAPMEYHQQMSIQNQHIACARWLCHFSIPSLVPDDDGISYRNIAEKARVPEHQLRKICRMAMTSGLFRELDSHTVEHTAISRGLRHGSPFLHAMTFLTETASTTANKMIDMTEQYGFSSAQNHTAFNIAFDTDLPFYAYSSKNPKLSDQLAGSMKFFGVGEELHLKHLVNGYDWKSLGDAKVVDVGGSQGHASIALASTFPDLSFTIQDLPEVIDRAKKAQVTSLPDPAVASRVSFEVHNFFQPQPPSSRSADVFLARLVLNNWHDNEAASILRSLVSVMKPSARIVIMSAVLPDPGAVNLREEAIERTRDMFMMQAMNGTERGLQEWKELFKQTDQRLILKQAVKPEGSNLSVLEVVLAEES